MGRVPNCRICCKRLRGFWYGDTVSQTPPARFRARHFDEVIIILCVRWYLRYSLSYRDLEEILAERRLAVDHVTIWRWVQRYAPLLNQRLRHELRRPNRCRGTSSRLARVAFGAGPCIC